MDVTATTTFNTNNFPARMENAESFPLPDKNHLSFELGFWLSGLESFLQIRNHSFTEEIRSKAAVSDWTKEFRMTRSTLLLCSNLAIQLGKARSSEKGTDETIELIEDDAPEGFEISVDEIYKLSQAVRDCVLLNEGLLRAAPLKFGEWSAWCGFLSDKFKTIEAFEKFINYAEKSGEGFLPEAFKELLKSKTISPVTEADLRLVLPHIAKILKWLSVVERMLKNDEPLQPALVVFSRIYEQIQELTSYINNRLLRFPNEEDQLFGALDGAAYTASIELRKVYNHELAGLSEIRPAPSIYAKMETAFSLLNDSFRQTLVSFAQLIEPDIEPARIFPDFQLKLNQSLILRQSLWEVLQLVKKTEKDPETISIQSLHEPLTDFLNTPIRFLFYKDMETVERFIEEVLITTSKKDLVPILHRFGAYLETLFGQVNMRVVLATHPFERNEA